MKELNEKTEKNKLLEEQQKLLKHQNEQNKILEQQIDEQKKLLEEQKKLVEEEEEENMLRGIMIENINSGPFIKFRKSAPRRDIKKPTPSPSKISIPISKSREPQSLAAGEQSTIETMKNDLKVSKDIIENLKKN